MEELENESVNEIDIEHGKSEEMKELINPKGKHIDVDDRDLTSKDDTKMEIS
jgi:hypothetical protein